MLDGLYVVRSILTISNLRSQDSGLVRCVATIIVEADQPPPLPEEGAAYLSVLGKCTIQCLYFTMKIHSEL